MFSALVNKLKVHRFRTNLKKHDNIAVLYHHIGEPVGFKSKFHSVSFKTFVSQIHFFQKHWQFVPENVFFEKVANNEKGFAVLTFDDGYKETFNKALPFLESNKIPYLFFVNSCSVINGWMWRDLLRWILDNGFRKKLLKETNWDIINTEALLQETKNPELFNSKEIVEDLKKFIIKIPETIESFKKLDLYVDIENIQQFKDFKYGFLGNHTANHFVLSTVSNKIIKDEINTNDEFLRKSIGTNKISKSFSMPFGSIKTFNNFTIQQLKGSGYKYLFISEPNAYKTGGEIYTTISDIPSVKRVLPKQNN